MCLFEGEFYTAMIVLAVEFWLKRAVRFEGGGQENRPLVPGMTVRECDKRTVPLSHQARNDGEGM